MERRYARGLFETDARVQAHITKVSDYTLRGPEWVHIDPVRYKKAMQTAWDRNESGWRTEAEAKAKLLSHWLTLNKT